MTDILQNSVAEWFTTLGLVFGGCCSNAWTLEIATAQNPHAGSLITFLQFLLVSLYGLYKHLSILSPREAVARRIIDDVLTVRGQRPHVGPIYMALQGAPQETADFTTSLLYDLKRVAPRIGVVLLNNEQNAGDLPRPNGGIVSLKSEASQTTELDKDLVIVCGENLDVLEPRKNWDYVVFLVKSTRGDLPSVRANPSLTINIASVMQPTIVHSSKQILPPDLLQWVSLFRLAPRAIPISRWIIQVILFLLTSLMNNAAFAYDIPMTVHIIFRSGGLVINMLIGCFVGGRRYSGAQVISVVLVTVGITLTTLSAMRPKTEATEVAAGHGSYFLGILLLTLALVMSGLMGLAQDRAYEQYGRGHWQEGLFYLHFLAMPGFAFVWRDLLAQLRMANASPRAMGVGIPSFYGPLLLNIVTQLVCVSGVHRLTSRVNSLTVTLVLVIRKAFSLGISVVVLDGGRGAGMWLWVGAALTFLGTVWYSIGGIPRERKKKRE